MKSKNVIACIMTAIMVVCLCSCGSKDSRDTKRTIDKPSSKVSEKAVETSDTVRLPIISNKAFEPETDKKKNTTDKYSDHSAASSYTESSYQSSKPDIASSNTASTVTAINEQQQTKPTDPVRHRLLPHRKGRG